MPGGKKKRTYQQKIKDAQRFAKDSQEELQQKDAELTKKIIIGPEGCNKEDGDR